MESKRQRGSGSLYQQKGSRFFWMKYYQNGRAYRQSTGKENRQDAEKVLSRKLKTVGTVLFRDPKTEKIKVQELADAFLRDYRINERKSIDDAETRWELHLKPHFGEVRVTNLTSDLIQEYIAIRQADEAKNATINRELACLRRMLRLGQQATPPKVHNIPNFPKLMERNTRTGFLEDQQYQKLIAAANELWLRALIETAFTYGWRVGELKNLKVTQVDLLNRSIRLNPGETKNEEGRLVKMTQRVFELLSSCAFGKKPEQFIFTRSDGKPIKDFRDIWKKVCKAAGVPDLLFHDLRRTAARNLRRAGVAEGVIMKVGGWKTRSVFERYAIVTESDISDAIHKLENRSGHNLGHSEAKQEPSPKRSNPN